MILLKKGIHRFKVHLRSNNELVETIDLDLTQEPETFEILYRKYHTRHEKWSNSIAEKFRGWRMIFTLNYSVKSGDLLTEKIGKLIDFGAENDVYYVFYPRADDPGFFLEVVDDNDELRLKLLAGDDAYEGLQLRFISKELVKKLNWFSPSTLAATYGGEHELPYTGEIES